MKKRNIVCILVIVLVLVGCITAYIFFTRDYSNDDKKVLFTYEDYPKVDASLATQPLATAFIKDFVNDDKIKDDQLNYSNTHPAYIKLINDEADLIVVTEPSEEELKLAQEKNVELEVIPVVKEGFVFFVNSSSKIDGLTLEQIQKIYTGEITNWKEVGGPDSKIKAYQRPENSGSQTGMKSLVMKDLKLMKPLTENVVDTMYAIVNLVSSYDNGVNSIGYSYYYYATTMFEDIDAAVANNIKLLAVNGVKPTNETIRDGSYPIQTAYYIVIRKDEPKNSKVRKLVDAMLSERGQKVAEEAGYVSLK